MSRQYYRSPTDERTNANMKAEVARLQHMLLRVRILNCPSLTSITDVRNVYILRTVWLRRTYPFIT